MMVLAPAWIAVSLAMIAAWFWQRRAGNAGWVDVVWTFATGGVGAVIACVIGNGWRSALVAAVALVWAIRLGGYIAARTRRGPEDTRYAQFRGEWGPRFQVRMFWFLQVQAAASGVSLLPIAVAALSPRPFGWLDGAAVMVAACAILGEGIADAQMHRFRADPGNHGKLCDTGLWGLSRHPNYFFEWLFWLSYCLFAVGAARGWLSLIGPVMMYWLLVHVSGIPPLEQQMLRSRGDAYRDYQRRVSAFFPFPKRGS